MAPNVEATLYRQLEFGPGGVCRLVFWREARVDKEIVDLEHDARWELKGARNPLYLLSV